MSTLSPPVPPPVLTVDDLVHTIAEDRHHTGPYGVITRVFTNQFGQQVCDVHWPELSDCPECYGLYLAAELTTEAVEPAVAVVAVAA